MERINIYDTNRIEKMMDDKDRLLERVLLEHDGVDREMSIGRAYFNSLVYVMGSKTPKIDKILSDKFIWTTAYKDFTSYKNELITYLFSNGIKAFLISRFIGKMIDLELKVIDKGDMFISFDLSYLDIFELCEREQWIEDIFMKDPDVSKEMDDNAIFEYRDQQFERLFDYIKKHEIEPFLTLFSSGIFKQVDFKSCFLSILKRPDPVQGGLLPTLNTSSWARGIQDKDSYHTELVTARNAVIISKKAVAKAGSLSNRMILLVYRSRILKEDVICDSINRLRLVIKDKEHLKRFMGRYKNVNGKPVKISSDDIGNSIELRSPTTCNCQDGLCKYCVGETYYLDNLSMPGDIIIKMIKDELESIVQKPISAKHSANAKIIAAFLAWASIKYKKYKIEDIINIVLANDEEDTDSLVINPDLNVESIYFKPDDTRDEDEGEKTYYISDVLYIDTGDIVFPVKINSEFRVDCEETYVSDEKIIINSMENLYHEPFTNIALTDTYVQFEKLLAKPSDYASNMLELIAKIDELLVENNPTVQHVVAEIIARGLIFDHNDDYIDFSKPVSLTEIKLNTLVVSIKKAKNMAIRHAVGFYSEVVLSDTLLDEDATVLPSGLDVMFK